jgi:hypothetical protein
MGRTAQCTQLVTEGPRTAEPGFCLAQGTCSKCRQLQRNVLAVGTADFYPESRAQTRQPCWSVPWSLSLQTCSMADSPYQGVTWPLCLPRCWVALSLPRFSVADWPYQGVTWPLSLPRCYVATVLAKVLRGSVLAKVLSGHCPYQGVPWPLSLPRCWVATVLTKVLSGTVLAKVLSGTALAKVLSGTVLTKVFRSRLTLPKCSVAFPSLSGNIPSGCLNAVITVSFHVPATTFFHLSSPHILSYGQRRELDCKENKEGCWKEPS